MTKFRLTKIALDYDETYSADPRLWDAFLGHAAFLGHRVWIVTLRSELLDQANFNLSHGARKCIEGILWCDGRPKRSVAKERGLVFDIWIDDRPETIDKGSELNAAQLDAWRGQQKRLAANV
jgi:hypothetical protein